MSSPPLLKEYRCSCGKLLFRSILVAGVVEIKCKRCSAVLIFGDTADIPYTFTFFVNREDIIDDVCGGVSVIGFERKALIGKPLSDIFSFVRDLPEPQADASRQAGLPLATRLLDICADTAQTGNERPYHLANNMLLLKDGPLSVESYIVPDFNTKRGQYRVFNVVHPRQ